MVGCSPDALVGDDDARAGVLELKCPRADTHLLWLARDAIPRDHVIQVQGHIWVTGRSWCDFQSYHPDFPSLRKRDEPDDTLQAAFDKHIPAFIADLLEGARPIARRWACQSQASIVTLATDLDPTRRIGRRQPMEGRMTDLTTDVTVTIHGTEIELDRRRRETICPAEPDVGIMRRLH